VSVPVALGPAKGYDERAGTYGDALIDGVSGSVDRFDEIAVCQMLDGRRPWRQLPPVAASAGTQST
jgi:hypothetical protein